MKIKKIDDHYSIIKTKKYKDISVFVFFTIPFSSYNKACLSVLSKLFGESSYAYQDKASLTRVKDMLYGANINSGISIRSNLISFKVEYSFLNPRFLKTNIKNYVDFFHEILYHTLVNENNVEEAKRNLISTYYRKLDKPQMLASENIYQIISEDDNSFKSYSLMEMIQEIEKISAKDVLKVYQLILKHSQIDTYLCGDIQKEFVSYFHFVSKRKKSLLCKRNKVTYEKKDRIEVKKDISQSYLSLLYQTPYNRHHPDFYNFVFGNIFLGVLPTSLLFSEVRERLGLCYSIGVIDYKTEGLVRIYTDIDGKNVDIVIDEIKKQMNKLIQQDYDITKFNMSKKLFMNILDSTYDDLSALIEYDLSNRFNGLNVSLQEYKRNIQKIKPEDLSRVFSQYSLYFTYLLKGSSNEENI